MTLEHRSRPMNYDDAFSFVLASILLEQKKTNATGDACIDRVCRWHISMPAIVAKSIAILSDAGLGMAMFSLGEYRS
jgi:hypothetical protein